MNALSHRRALAVHLAQLEQNGIKQVVGDALRTSLSPEAARRLADQHVCRLHRHHRLGASALGDSKGWRRGQRPFALADQGRREVLCQLTGEVPGPNPRPGHPFADDVRRMHYDP